LVPGEQQPALARFGRLHSAAYLDRGNPNVSRSDNPVEMLVRAIAKPESHSDDSEQRDEA
jgi:hypothetical protein